MTLATKQQEIENGGNWTLMPMPRWRDGQPGCKDCFCDLHIGMKVYFHGWLYYCVGCGKKRKKNS